jgi:hypothetical protein
MIRVRQADSDADFEAWSRVKRAVLPNESAWTVQEFRIARTLSDSCSSRSSTAKSSVLD